MRSDCGTQFSNEFQKFSKEYDFSHATSSPKYYQSNVGVEAAVKSAKSILKKSNDFNLGLLAYRTTPLENGYSPAELMISRKIRSRLPNHPDNLGTFRHHHKITPKEKERKDRQENDYNKRHRVTKLSKLKINDRVWIIDMRIYGKILKPDKNPNFCIIQFEKCNMIRRNRSHLVPAPYREYVDASHKKNVNFLPYDVDDNNPSNRPNIVEHPQAQEPLQGDDNVQVQRNDRIVQNVQHDQNLNAQDELRRSTRTIKQSERLNL